MNTKKIEKNLNILNKKEFSWHDLVDVGLFENYNHYKNFIYNQQPYLLTTSTLKLDPINHRYTRVFSKKNVKTMINKHLDQLKKYRSIKKLTKDTKNKSEIKNHKINSDKFENIWINLIKNVEDLEKTLCSLVSYCHEKKGGECFK